MYTWAYINRKRVKHIRAAERMLQRQFSQIRRQLAEKLKGYNDPNGLLEAVEGFEVDEQILRDAWNRIYQTTGLEFAEMNFKHMKSGKRNIEKKDINDTIRRSVWLRKLLEYVDTECGSLIQDTTRAMFAGIQRNAQKAIAMAAESGWGADRTASEIIRLQGQMDRYRAQRIARTEVMRASNFGAMEGAEELGIALTKIWISTADGRERDWHIGVEPVDYNDKFNVGGELLDYPGDPEGSEENTINCRCAVAFEPKDSILDRV